MKYIGDWVYDDEPTTIRTARGPLATLPYTVEVNDIPIMVVHQHESDICSNAPSTSFDRLYAREVERAEDHVARDPSLHKRAAVPDQISRSDLRLRQQVPRASCTGMASRSSTGTRARPPRSRDRRRERRGPAGAAGDPRYRSAGCGRQFLSRSPGLLRRPQLCRPHPRDEGSRRARSAVLLSETAGRRGA